MKDGPKELPPKRVNTPLKRVNMTESLPDDSRSSQRRILLVLETVIRCGPISLQDLTELLGLSEEEFGSLLGDRLELDRIREEARKEASKG